MKNKLACEKQPYKEHLRENLKENSMIYQFYLWLYKKSKTKK